MYDPDLYRSKIEVENWKQHCPIQNWLFKLQELGWINEYEFTEIKNEVESEMAAAVKFAEASEFEDVSELQKFTYANRDKTVSMETVE